MNAFMIKLTIVLKLELKISINELKSAFMIEFKSVLVHELKRLRNVLIKKLSLFMIVLIHVIAKAQKCAH